MKAKRLIYSYLFCILIIILFASLAWTNEQTVLETGYYTSLTEALADASAHTTENADTDAASAAAAVNIYRSGKCEAVMIKDASLVSDLNITDAAFIFNMNGKELRLCGGTVTVCGGRVAIEGRDGSILNENDTDAAYGIRVLADRETKLSINELNISVTARQKALGVACIGEERAEVRLKDCSIKALTTTSEGREVTAAFFTNPDTDIDLCINGGTYIADSKNRLINPQNGASNTVGIRIQQTHGIIRLDGVSAIGIHSGISTSANTVLKNSYCSSPTHGGMYNGGTLIAENTVFENSAYSGECKDPEQIAKLPRLGAMYNGSAARCAVAYLDNCQFINGEASYGLVVSTNYGYKSPSVYLSNTTVKDLRVDGERADNKGSFATAHIGTNVTYTLKSSGGIIDTEDYRRVSFGYKWAKISVSEFALNQH